ncbi:MAG: hypothetical protein ACREVX_04320 [Clostridium sp.]|uniref:hypothetical protein n=1 Tax=Clostridium sp. TaxID=1506 RepID=UPI003D6DA1EF
MKNTIKNLFIFITVLAIIGIVYLMVLFPVHKYRANMVVDKSFDVKAMLLKAVPKNFSLKQRKMETTISLTEDELKGLILSEMKKKGNVDGVEISIANNKIDIYVKQKVWKYFPVELSLSFKSEIKDDKVKLILETSKIGKLDLDKEKVLDKIKDNKITGFDVRPLAGEIILEDEEIKDLIVVKATRLYDHKASVDIEVELNSIEDFMELMKIVREN